MKCLSRLPNVIKNESLIECTLKGLRREDFFERELLGLEDFHEEDCIGNADWDARGKLGNPRLIEFCEHFIAELMSFIMSIFDCCSFVRSSTVTMNRIP